MISKLKEKQKAIALREKGYSYSEILKQVPVAKSTLSLWLRSVGLSKRQKQRLTEKKLAAMRRGWEACRRKKLEKIELIKKEARRELRSVSKRDLWMLGIALYWAEGTKEREKASLVQFGNSDPRMIQLFLRWIQDICKIPKQDIKFEIYLHKSAARRKQEVQKYWAKVSNCPTDRLQAIRWKKHNLNPKRKNIGKDYYGLLRVTISRSVALNRKIEGWVESICDKT